MQIFLNVLVSPLAGPSTEQDACKLSLETEPTIWAPKYGVTIKLIMSWLERNVFL